MQHSEIHQDDETKRQNWAVQATRLRKFRDVEIKCTNYLLYLNFKQENGDTILTELEQTPYAKIDSKFIEIWTAQILCKAKTH